MPCLCGHTEEEHPGRRECMYEGDDIDDPNSPADDWRCPCVVYEEEPDEDQP